MGDAGWNFPLGEVAHAREFDAFVAAREPIVLAFRRGGEIDGVRQAATE